MFSLFAKRRNMRNRLTAEASLEPPMVQELRKMVLGLNEEKLDELFTAVEPIETEAGFRLVNPYLETYSATELGKWLKIACRSLVDVSYRDFTDKARDALSSTSYLNPDQN